MLVASPHLSCEQIICHCGRIIHVRRIRYFLITMVPSRVHNYTEESIKHWNRSAESNATSGGLHVIVHASAYTRGAKKKPGRGLAQTVNTRSGNIEVNSIEVVYPENRPSSVHSAACLWWGALGGNSNSSHITRILYYELFETMPSSKAGKFY